MSEMTAHFDPSVYDQLPLEVRLYALGLLTPPVHESCTYRGGALDTKTRTRERFGKVPFSTQVVGSEALKRWVLALARHLVRRRPAKGLESVRRALSRRQLAFLALRAVLDRIYAGWGKRGRKIIKNPDRHFRQELGYAVRDELEFGGLLAAKPWVRAAKNMAGRRARLGK